MIKIIIFAIDVSRNEKLMFQELISFQDDVVNDYKMYLNFSYAITLVHASL